jgi:hypothetical protein
MPTSHARTHKDKEDGALGGAILLGTLGALTGGWGLLLGAGAGGALGAGGVNEVDRKRFVDVMYDFYGGAVIEALPVHYATLYHQRAHYGLRSQAVLAGDLANAVGASIANPFIFQDVDVRVERSMDPGADRVMAVPVEDACKLYPQAALIVVNVTDEPAFFSAAMRCPLLEVRVPVPQAGPQAMMRGAEFDTYVKAGFDATEQTLVRNP